MMQGDTSNGSVSELRLYSLGLVAENILVGGDNKAGSKTILVTPIEALNFIDGAIKSNPTPDTVTANDASGATVQTKVTTDNTIQADWFPFHSNRVSPPTVRRGERVLLFRYSDRDQYLWTELGLDHHLRSAEIVQYAWNATPNEGGAEPGPTNSYFLEINGINGVVTFSTSKANSEKTTYTLQLNPKEGQFTFVDDVGQAFFIDSMNHVIHLVNADQSEITLDKQDITVKCADTANFTADKTFNITTETFNVKATTVNVTATDINLNASGQLKGSGSSITLSAPTLTLGQVVITDGHIGCDGIDSTGPVHAPNIH